MEFIKKKKNPNSNLKAQASQMVTPHLTLSHLGKQADAGCSQIPRAGCRGLCPRKTQGT